MQRPTPRSIRLFIFLSAILLYVSSNRWIDTRDYTPLDIPISLTPGNITQSFCTNIAGGYHILIAEEEKSANNGTIDCLLAGCSNRPSVLHVKWSIRHKSRIISQGTSDDQSGSRWFGFNRQTRVIGWTYLKRGTYTLELQIASDASVLNPGRPELGINADGSVYNKASYLYQCLCIASAVFGFLGLSTFLFLPRALAVEFPSPTGNALQPPDRISRFPGTGCRIGLPTYGFMAAVVFASLGLVMMVLTGEWHYHNKGLWVGLLKPGTQIFQSDPWVKPIVVHVTATTRRCTPEEMKSRPFYMTICDSTEHFILNGEDHSETIFKIKLREILVNRADRTVYLMGDDNMTYETVVNAIDAARQSYASRVVLLTNGNALPKSQ